MENKMNLYKNNQNEIFGLSPLDIDNNRHEGLTKLTAKEVEAHLNPVKTDEKNLIIKIQEFKSYLNDTDHKFYGDYELKPNEDLEPIRLKRSEAREFIRANEIL